MSLKTSSKEVKCNTKIKEYRDGSYTITRSDRHIFKDPAFEYHYFGLLVGVTGFEPTTSTTPSPRKPTHEVRRVFFYARSMKF